MAGQAWQEIQSVVSLFRLLGGKEQVLLHPALSPAFQSCIVALIRSIILITFSVCEGRIPISPLSNLFPISPLSHYPESRHLFVQCIMSTVCLSGVCMYVSVKIRQTAEWPQVQWGRSLSWNGRGWHGCGWGGNYERRDI